MSADLYKIVMIGPEESGKTSLLRVYMGAEFSEKYTPNESPEWTPRYPFITANFEFFDLPRGGANDLDDLEGHLRDAEGIILVLDATQPPEALQAVVRDYIEKIKGVYPYPIFLIANKYDNLKDDNLKDSQALNNLKRILETFVKSYGFSSYFICSAKTQHELETSFNTILTQLFNHEPVHRLFDDLERLSQLLKEENPIFSMVLARLIEVLKNDCLHQIGDVQGEYAYHYCHEIFASPAGKTALVTQKFLQAFMKAQTLEQRQMLIQAYQETCGVKPQPSSFLTTLSIFKDPLTDLVRSFVVQANKLAVTMEEGYALTETEQESQESTEAVAESKPPKLNT